MHPRPVVGMECACLLGRVTAVSVKKTTQEKIVRPSVHPPIEKLFISSLLKIQCIFKFHCSSPSDVNFMICTHCHSFFLQELSEFEAESVQRESHHVEVIPFNVLH